MTDVFRRLKYKLDRKTLYTIYITFVRPKLEYGCILFDDCTEFDKTRIENTQLTFARVICGAKKGTSHDAIYNEISLPKLEDRRRENKLKFIHKIINHNAPHYLNILPEQNDNRYNLRNSDEQNQFRFHTTKFQNPLLPNCIKLWNELDSNIRQISDMESFKKIITNSFVQNPLFNGHTRSLALIHAQLRMHCSNLMADLHKLHVDSPQCSCMTGVEDNFHYFFKCPLYNLERIHLFNSIEPLCNISIDTLLFGNNLLSLDVNVQIFTSVERFILETERFASIVK